MYARCLHHVDRAAYLCSGGRFTATSFFAGLPLGMLTTTGARTGQERTTPVLCLLVPNAGDDIALVASNWGQPRFPAWYHNLVKTPAATCAVKGVLHRYAAREAQAREYEYHWQLAMDTYVGFAAHKERAGKRRIPILILSRQVGA